MVRLSCDSLEGVQVMSSDANPGGGHQLVHLWVQSPTRHERQERRTSQQGEILLTVALRLRSSTASVLSAAQGSRAGLEASPTVRLSVGQGRRGLVSSCYFPLIPEAVLKKWSRMYKKTRLQERWSLHFSWKTLEMTSGCINYGTALTWNVIQPLIIML